VAGRGGGARALWGLGEARTEPRQVPADAEVDQKRLSCRSEKRSRETSVTLPAAVKPRAGSLSNPVVGLVAIYMKINPVPRAAGSLLKYNRAYNRRRASLA
jgi:hypothetical protein